jgi:hypothetical protein
MEPLEFSSMTSRQVVDEWLDYDASVKHYAEMRDRTSMELRQRMVTDEATKVLHPGAKVTLETKPVFNQSVLRGLLEFLTEEELIELGAFTPETSEQVVTPEKWNMTKVNALRSLGKDIAEVVHRARTELPATVKIVRIKEKPE